MKTKPLFIVISAPSGCGKSTLIDMLLQEYHDLVYSISCTTRAPRGEEEDGLDYHFKTKELFISVTLFVTNLLIPFIVFSFESFKRKFRLQI